MSELRPRGTPPNQKQLSKDLGPRLVLWDSVIEMGKGMEATWSWQHSDMTDRWSYRAYLPGNRFLMTLSPLGEHFEVSLNLKAEEWDFVHAVDPAENAFLEELRAKALASGEDPAWLHVQVDAQSTLPALAKLLLARGRRVQPPRGKKRR